MCAKCDRLSSNFLSMDAFNFSAKSNFIVDSLAKRNFNVRSALIRLKSILEKALEVASKHSNTDNNLFIFAILISSALISFG